MPKKHRRSSVPPEQCSPYGTDFRCEERPFTGLTNFVIPDIRAARVRLPGIILSVVAAALLVLKLPFRHPE